MIKFILDSLLHKRLFDLFFEKIKNCDDSGSISMDVDGEKISLKICHPMEIFNNQITFYMTEK